MDKEIFDRGIALQMAQTQEEALNILRTDPLLTEEEAQEMSKSWAKAENNKEEEGRMRLKILGVIPAKDEERIKLMKSSLHFTEEKARETLEELKAIDEDAKQQTGRPTWDDFFSVDSREEKLAILKKKYGDSLTQEEVERFLAIE